MTTHTPTGDFQPVEALKLASALRMFARRFILDRTIARLTNSASALEALAAKVAELQANHLESERQLQKAHDEIGALLESVNTLEPLNKGLRQRIQTLEADCASFREVFNLAKTWPLTDVLTKLCQATAHLLDRHNCDTDGYEQFRHALDAGRQIRAQLNAVLPIGSGQRLLDRIQTLESQSAAMRSALEKLIAWVGAPTNYNYHTLAVVHDAAQAALATDAGKDIAQDKAIVDWCEANPAEVPWKHIHRDGWYASRNKDVSCGSFETFRAACLDAMKAEGAK